MSYASKYPKNIAALIIEDMDIRQRPMSMNLFQSKNREASIAFNRDLNVGSIEEVISIFENEGYPSDSIDKWIEEGRIVLKNDGVNSSTYYSEVNPAFRQLCYEQFFVTNHGEKTWTAIARNKVFSFPCHIMVASQEGTVCDNKSIWHMQQIMKETSDFRMILHRYNKANHSIHNSSKGDFLRDLKTIIGTSNTQ